MLIEEDENPEYSQTTNEQSEILNSCLEFCKIQIDQKIEQI